MTIEQLHINGERLAAAARKFFAVPMFCSECGFASLMDDDFVIHDERRLCARFFECSRRRDASDVAMGWKMEAGS